MSSRKEAEPAVVVNVILPDPPYAQALAKDPTTAVQYTARFLKTPNQRVGRHVGPRIKITLQNPDTGQVLRVVKDVTICVHSSGTLTVEDAEAYAEVTPEFIKETVNGGNDVGVD